MDLSGVDEEHIMANVNIRRPTSKSRFASADRKDQFANRIRKLLALPAALEPAGASRLGVGRLEVAARPIAPTLVQVVEVDEQWQQLGMAVVRALDVANRDVVARAREQMDGVAGPHVTGSLDGEVCAGPSRFGEAAYEGSIAHPNAELEARYAWLG